MELRITTLRQEAKKFRGHDNDTFMRINALLCLAKRQEDGSKLRELDYVRVSIDFEVSMRTLRRWLAAYLKGGAKALMRKKAPGKKRKPIKGHTAKIINRYRKRYNWGAEVLQAHLLLDHQIKISKDRIHRYLIRNNFVIQKRRYRKKKLHTRIVNVATPGAHTQEDVKHLPHTLPNGKKCYVYNFNDHASRFEFKYAYESYGPMETKDFMSRLLDIVPFKILRLQTDNGIECTNKFLSNIDDVKEHVLDRICRENNIRHALIPPGQKELQGLVERSHRMDDEQFYHRIKPVDIYEFNKDLTAYCIWKNKSRRRKALKWKSPMQWLEDYKSGAEKKTQGDVRQNSLISGTAKLPHVVKGTSMKIGNNRVVQITDSGELTLIKKLNFCSPSRPLSFQLFSEKSYKRKKQKTKTLEQCSDIENELIRKAA
jgi:transposase